MPPAAVVRLTEPATLVRLLAALDRAGFVLAVFDADPAERVTVEALSAQMRAAESLRVVRPVAALYGAAVMQPGPPDAGDGERVAVLAPSRVVSWAPPTCVVGLVAPRDAASPAAGHLGRMP